MRAWIHRPMRIHDLSRIRETLLAREVRPDLAFGPGG